MPAVSVTLYAIPPSHPAHAARLMLEHKGIEHKVVNLVPGTHAAVVRALGFRRGTVPALNPRAVRSLRIDKFVERLASEISAPQMA